MFTINRFTLHNITKSADLRSYFVTSHPCPTCDVSVTVTITPPQLFAYNQGAYAQVVLADYNADVREQFISGTCPDCWNAMFSLYEDED